MSYPHYSTINILVQRISATRPMAWFFARYLHRIDRLFLRLSKGKMTLTSYLAGLPVVVLTTTGARSGLLRTTSLACIIDPENHGQFAILASNFGQPHHPAWYYNLKAEPHALGSIDGQKKRYVAHEASDAEYSRFWSYAIKIFPGYIQYQKRLLKRRIPIMVLMEEGD